jgi:PGF-pre-PGF domain-containing protein
VSISVKNAVVNVSISVDKLEEKPLEIEVTPPGEIYSYFKIDTKNITEVDISTATVKIKVEKAWLESAGISVDAVVLCRYHNGEWQRLTVEKIDDDGTYVYYRVTTPGFSTFAITGEQVGISLLLVVAAVILATILSIAVTKYIVFKKGSKVRR